MEEGRKKGKGRKERGRNKEEVEITVQILSLLKFIIQYLIFNKNHRVHGWVGGWCVCVCVYSVGGGRKGKADGLCRDRHWGHL